MYDVMIIGSGPAGVSAALTAKARNLDLIWFGSRNLSRKITRAEKIVNYPGLTAVSGNEMKDAFLRQIEASGITLTEARVDSVYPMGESFMASAEGQIYEARSVILAVGMETAKVIPGEEEFLGRGVSYCATCDGNLYRGKRLAVVCTDPELEDEIAFLASLASHVTVYATYKTFSLEAENLSWKNGYPLEIGGTDRVESVTDRDGSEAADGVFFLEASISPGILLRGLETENGHIVVKRDQSTSVAGCFAAGDCTGRPYQYAKAVGEGNVALHSVLNYLK